MDVKLFHRYLLHMKFSKTKILQIKLLIYHHLDKIITQDEVNSFSEGCKHLEL